MICLDCADAAEAQGNSILSYSEAANYADEMVHPTDCGCTCQHKPVGSIEILRPKDE